MAMHASEDANFSDHFDGGDKTNERLNQGVRRKRRKVVKSSLGKPFALMKTSRIRKNVIPIGKEVGGYKKAQQHQHSHWDLKKKRIQGKKSIAKVRESESGKTHNKDLVEPFGSKTGPSEDEEDEEDFCGLRNLDKAWFNSDLFLVVKDESDTETYKNFLEKWGSNKKKRS